jgi:hypothetical protein
VKFRDTYVERKPSERANDRNDRAFQTTCHWYQTLLEERQKMLGAGKKFKIILLTQDAENRELAIQEGLHAYKSKLRICMNIFVSISLKGCFFWYLS